MTNEQQISIRVPSELLERADRLIGRLGKRAELRAWGGRTTRSNVLRLALLRGLDALEADAKHQ